MFGVHRRYDDDSGKIVKIAPGELFEMKLYGESANMEEKFYGEQGHDTIWLGGKVATHSRAFGGTGDDKLYGGRSVTGDTWLYGGADSDIIRTDWWTSRDDTIPNGGDEYIWGDYKYGEDNLDKDLWGDADKIYGGKGNDAGKQKIYGGDGADSIHQGKNWSEGLIYGQNGDDTIYLGEDYIGTNKIFGGSGDDTWVNSVSYEDRTAGLIGAEYYFGGLGNDYIASSHKSDGITFLYGGAGEDIIVQGDEGTGGSYGFMVGNDGDDKIYGGYKGDFSDNEWIYGDSVAYDDTLDIYGSDAYGAL